MSIKKSTNLSELLFYLEEFYEMDLLNSKEESILHTYQWKHKMSKSDALYIYNRMQKHYNEAF